jgi:hypothetical protein
MRTFFCTYKHISKDRFPRSNNDVVLSWCPILLIPFVISIIGIINQKPIRCEDMGNWSMRNIPARCIEYWNKK